MKLSGKGTKKSEAIKFVEYFLIMNVFFVNLQTFLNNFLILI